MSDPDPAARAEAARRKILASGDPELIRRLQLLEATAPTAAAQPAQTTEGRSGPGLLGMGLAVAGGAWLGTVLGGLTLSGEMSRAFADVAEDLGVDMTGVDPSDLSDPAGGEAETLSASADDGDAGGDVFDGFGDIFDI